MNTLDIHQAAALAKCHPETMRKMMKARVAPGARIGRKWIIDEPTLQEWLRLGPVRFWRNVRRQRRRAETRADRLPRELAFYAKYRASKAKRSPPWADQVAIQCMYAIARRVSDCLGIPHHIDHIVPLHGTSVSGLHVEQNLRVIPKQLNLSKGRKWP